MHGGSRHAPRCYGFTEDVAARIDASISREESDVGGIGGTLAANVLSLSAMHATLSDVLTEEAFARMIALGERADVDRHAEVFAEATAAVAGLSRAA